MDYNTSVYGRDGYQADAYAHQTYQRAGRAGRRRFMLIGLLAAGAVVVSATAGYAATGGRVVTMLTGSHGTGKPATAGNGRGAAGGGPGAARQSPSPNGAGGSSSDDAKMVDPSYSPSMAPGQSMPSIAFLTVDDPADPTFNQLLGINDLGRIGGYFGSGADAAHPNKGYQVRPHDGETAFTNQNVPGSAQTQVVGINNDSTTVGFSVDKLGVNAGFVQSHGMFQAVANPATTASPAFNQLLGVNNRGVAVGFYNDANGASHGYLYQIQTRKFTPVTLPVHADSVVASGINDRGDISGFYTVGKVTTGFLIHDRHFTALSFGGRTNTQALGVNNSDQVVGSFVDGAGAMHGFVWHDGNLTRVDAPKATAGTVINGINNHNQLVGFFVDAKGNTNGLLARLIKS